MSSDSLLGTVAVILLIGFLLRPAEFGERAAKVKLAYDAQIQKDSQ